MNNKNWLPIYDQTTKEERKKRRKKKTLTVVFYDFYEWTEIGYA